MYLLLFTQILSDASIIVCIHIIDVSIIVHINTIICLYYCSHKYYQMPLLLYTYIFTDESIIVHINIIRCLISLYTKPLSDVSITVHINIIRCRLYRVTHKTDSVLPCRTNRSCTIQETTLQSGCRNFLHFLGTSFLGFGVRKCIFVKSVQLEMTLQFKPRMD